MKVKVIIYQEKSIGAPLGLIMDPIYAEASDIQDLGRMVVAALNEVQAYLPDQEVITLVDSMGINRVLDLINLQVYLRKVGLLLVVGTVNEEHSVNGNYIEVVSPNLELLPDISNFDINEDQDQTVEIVSSIVNKYSLGDLSLVPESQIKTSLMAIQDMSSKGMTIFPVYKDSLSNSLIDYGFQIYYVIVG